MSSSPADDPRVTRWSTSRPDPDGRCVVYWMQRAQRPVDNPALDLAVDLGNEMGLPVVVFFGLHAGIARANLRHYHFLAEGLPDIEAGLQARRVGFVLRRHPDHGLPRFATEVQAAIVVGDECPLRQFAGWRQRMSVELRVPLWTVDADVVVPTKLLPGEQYAARTIRPRIHRRLEEFLVRGHEPSARVEWQPLAGLSRLRAGTAILDGLPLDRSLPPVKTFVGGTTEARRRLDAFVRAVAGTYDKGRNHPEESATSTLSPYLHFGHVGPREVALAVRESGMDDESKAAYLEQLIVRRELAVSFATFNPRYDQFASCEPWAQKTLRQHLGDARQYRYSEAQFDAAETHDPLWNAAQRQMTSTGWMHGYIRMYWAKKILEWTASPEEAFEIAVRLNDRYELDGRDPNGYANIAWAIGGKHDRPWPPRPIYGTVRSMSFTSTARKFDSARYIAQWGLGRPETAAERSI